MRPLCEVEDCLADITERAYIKTFNTLTPNGYNIMEGGQANRGMFSIDFCKRMSEVRKGVKLSEEHKAKISASLKKTLSAPEAKEKRKAELTGRKHSESTKAKISAMKKGRIFSDAHRASLSKALKEYNAKRRELA